MFHVSQTLHTHYQRANATFQLSLLLLQRKQEISYQAELVEGRIFRDYQQQCQ